MKIVIDIDERAYDWLKNGYPDEKDGEYAIRIILNGTPLPKNHGRLIDADVLVDGIEDNYELCMEVNATPTIIPSEREEKK